MCTISHRVIKPRLIRHLAIFKANVGSFSRRTLEGIKVSLHCSLTHFLCPSGIAGMVAQTTIAPVDRMKILLQAQNEHYKHLSKSVEFKSPSAMLLQAYTY